MKKILLTLAFIFLCGYAQSDCVAEIKSIRIDDKLGSIIAETQYTLNGVDVQLGKVRYSRIYATTNDIKQEISEDIDIHCKNLIARMDTNKAYIKEQMLLRYKELSQETIDGIKSTTLGIKSTQTEFSTTFMGKVINVKADGTTSTTDAP